MSCNEWKEYVLDDIGEIVGGGTPSTKNEEFYGNDISWITPKDLSGHTSKYISKGERSITNLGLAKSSAKLLPKGTVLFSSRAPIGYVAIASNELSTNQGFKSIVCNPDIANNEFIYYRMKMAKQELESIAGGSTFKEVSGKVMKEFKINLPPLEEQEKIANILSSLDDKIELNNGMNKTLEEMAQALFKRWFVDFEFPNENGEPYKSSGGEMVESELGMIPKGWEVKSLDEIADFLNGLAMQKFRPKEDDKDYLPVLKIKELKQGTTSNDSDRCSCNIDSKYIINDGDIIFAWSGSLDVRIWCGGKAGLNQHLFKVTSKDYPKWFYYLWVKMYLDDFIRIAADRATTMGHIKRANLSEAKVLVPNKEILKFMGDKLEYLINANIEKNIEVKSLKELRDTLLPKLMSGEIYV